MKNYKKMKLLLEENKPYNYGDIFYKISILDLLKVFANFCLINVACLHLKFII